MYSDNVYRFILKQIRDEDKAKDIVQDTFTKLWTKAETVSFEKARSYLFTAAHHTMIDMIRKDKRTDNVDDVNKYGGTYEQVQPDLKEKLNEALERLPEMQKSVVLLRDYEGYSYEEIGQITGLNEQQVKVYIYRARLALKKYIGSIETLV